MLKGLWLHVRCKYDTCHSHDNYEVDGLASSAPVLSIERLALAICYYNALVAQLTKGSFGSVVGTGSSITTCWPEVSSSSSAMC